jgi:tryptophanyl-tRNA synthetase
MEQFMSKKERVLSGMRPTGPLHLGHYHGVIKNWIELQKNYDCFYFVADWHALTTEYADPKDTAKWTYEMLLDWLSVGLDPKHATIFIQSKILEHSELHVLLSMLTPLGWLNRVPSYKEIREQLTNRDLSTYGFLGYPLLQTADIVMYKAARVPVGEDQVAHVELSREVVRRFNFLYGEEVLVEPQSLLTKTPKVPGLDKRKMSKSYDNCVFMSDDADTLGKKIMPAVTDPARVRRTDPGNPDVCLVHDYHKLYSTPEVIKEVEDGCKSAAIGCVDCKKKLLEYMNKFWEPVRDKRKKLNEKPDYVWDVVRDGNKRAEKIARETMDHVRSAMKIEYKEL